MEFPPLELTPEVARAARCLAEVVQSHDGRAPLNEDAALVLTDGRSREARPAEGEALPAEGAEPMHLGVLADRELAGYAQLDPETGVAQVMVAPEHRRRGLGSGLVRALERVQPELRVWAFGDLPAARGLAADLGYAPGRELLVMERSLTEPPAATPAPAGFEIRPFRPGADEEEWLALNSRVFAAHPEQGRIDRTDLAARMAEDWFDPNGFLVATRDDTMVGYHWTKRVSNGRESPDQGEVYVIGVAPETAGSGLGRALLRAGLVTLRHSGVTSVLLYVEGDNTRAVAMYAADGFEVVNRDVMYDRGQEQ